MLRVYIASKLLCRASSSTAVSSKSPTEALDIAIDYKSPMHLKLEKRFSNAGVVAPYYRRVNLLGSSVNARFNDNEAFLRKEYAPKGELDGTNVRLYDYYKIGKYVQQLETPSQRIDYVNPFERDFTRFEKRWHRPWHPDLFRPRKAWAVPPIPSYFDTMDFYKYLTKTRIITPEDDENEKLFNEYYKDLNLPIETFEKNMEDLLVSYGANENGLSKDNISHFLKSMIDLAMISLPLRTSRYHNYRISNTERCESFWIRAGFLHFYQRKKIWNAHNHIATNYRFAGDDRRRLGELTFTMRDNHAVQIRTQDGDRLKPLFSWDDEVNLSKPIFKDDIDVKDTVLYSPRIYNLRVDGDHLWQCPGFDYDSDDPYKFGRLAVKNVSELSERFAHWKIDKRDDPDEYDTAFKENYYSIAVTTLFNWLNAQAHCLGYTQYTDLSFEPLVSQLILSDGQHFLFAIGQLNTIAVNVDVFGFDNDRTNVCLMSSPQSLFDRYDHASRKFYYTDKSGKESEGLNKEVLLRILQMLL